MEPDKGCVRMKIEKINDNQIRCTLTREDLETHQVHLSELAYGTEKAKQLFRDMMQQAQLQFGFEADNIPLMIEAIPLSTESIILIITKVTDPEELDTRFSKFAPMKGDASSGTFEFDGADSILDLIQKLKNKARQAAEQIAGTNQKKESGPSAEAEELVRLYSFNSLDDIISASKNLNTFYHEKNSLYRDQLTGLYNLVIHQGNASPEEFNKVCNILSEYGSGKAFTKAGEAYLHEHGDIINADPLGFFGML